MPLKLISYYTLSGQPKFENGKRADENHVSKTSSSLKKKVYRVDFCISNSAMFQKTLNNYLFKKNSGPITKLWRKSLKKLDS